jgi:hypothetical protein
VPAGVSWPLDPTGKTILGPREGKSWTNLSWVTNISEERNSHHHLQEDTASQPTRLHGVTTHKTTRRHNPQDYTASQPTWLHGVTTHKTTRRHDSHDYTASQPTWLHGVTTHKTTRRHNPQDYTASQPTWPHGVTTQDYTASQPTWLHGVTTHKTTRRHDPQDNNRQVWSCLYGYYTSMHQLLRLHRVEWWIGYKSKRPRSKVLISHLPRDCAKPRKTSISRESLRVDLKPVSLVTEYEWQPLDPAYGFALYQHHTNIFDIKPQKEIISNETRHKWNGYAGTWQPQWWLLTKANRTTMFLKGQELKLDRLLLRSTLWVVNLSHHVAQC